MPYRNVKVTYKKLANNAPFTNPLVMKIQLDKNDFDLTDLEMHPTDAMEFPLTAQGTLADSNGASAGVLSLWCNAGGQTGSKYIVTDPDGQTWSFVLAFGDGTEIDLTTARAAGTVPANPVTVQQLIDAHALVKATTLQLGHVRVDGTTIAADASGIISAIGGGTGGMSVGGAVANSVAKRVPYIGTGGVLAIDDDMQFDDTNSTFFITKILCGGGAAHVGSGTPFGIESASPTGNGGAMFGTADNAGVGFFNLRSGTRFWHFNIRSNGEGNQFTLYFFNGGGYSTPFLTMTNVGRLGINKSNPESHFHVATSSNGLGVAMFEIGAGHGVDSVILNKAGVYAWRLDHNGVPITNGNAAPTDAALANGQLAYWLDTATNRVKFKARGGDGVIRNAELVLA